MSIEPGRCHGAIHTDSPIRRRHRRIHDTNYDGNRNDTVYSGDEDRPDGLDPQDSQNPSAADVAAFPSF